MSNLSVFCFWLLLCLPGIRKIPSPGRFVCCLAFGAKSIKLLWNPISRRFSLIFSSKRFILLALKFRYLTYFELNFAYGIKGPTSLFCERVPSFLSPLLKRTALFPLNSCHHYQKSFDHIYTRVYFWVLYSILLVLICLYGIVLMSVPYFL